MYAELRARERGVLVGIGGLTGALGGFFTLGVTGYSASQEENLTKLSNSQHILYFTIGTINWSS